MELIKRLNKKTLIFFVINAAVSIVASYIIVQILLHILHVNLSLAERLPLFLLVFVIIDISFLLFSINEQKRSRDEQQLLDVFENSTQGIFILDENKNVVYVNGYGRELLKVQEKRPFHFCEICSNYPGAEKICDVSICFLQNDYENPVHLYVKNQHKKLIPIQANISHYTTSKNQKGTIIGLQTESEKRKEENREIEKMITHSIFQAQEKERKRISRELHDGIGQSLYGILIQTDILKTIIHQENLQKHVEKLQSMIQQTIEDVRNLSAELRPATLDDHGFIITLKNFIRDISNRFAMQINFTVKGNNERLDASIETALYRIAQEALINAAKYSCAERVDVLIDMERNEGEVYLSVTDFGKGFEINSKNGKGVGIYSMEERAHILGGKFHIESILGKGTKLEVTIPLICN